jgi:hypothetical protein
MSCNCNNNQDSSGDVSLIGIILGIINFFFFEWLLGGLTDTQAFWLAIITLIETPFVMAFIDYLKSKRK